MRLLAAAAVLVIAPFAVAQEHGTHAAKSEPAAHHESAGESAHGAGVHAADPNPHPTIPDDASWAKPLVWAILLAGFGMAIVVGPIMRANTPEELPPPAHSHDEPPGTSGHHGTSGTLNEPPADVAYEEGHGHPPHH